VNSLSKSLLFTLRATAGDDALPWPGLHLSRQVGFILRRSIPVLAMVRFLLLMRISLGSCRDAACVGNNTYTEAGKLVLKSEQLAADKWSTGAVNTWGKASWKPSDGTFRVCVSAKLPGAGAGRSQVSKSCDLPVHVYDADLSS